MGIKPLDNTPTTTTMLYAKLLSLAITPALFSAEHMEFAGNGCCRFDDWTGHWYSPPGGVGVTAAECKQACLNSNSCVASDMNSRNECFHFRGPIANFRLGCEADNMCWLKKETMAGMQFIGMGYCDQHYYAGWDGKGLDNKQDCMNVCQSEPECTHVAFNRGKTCSRYYGDHCTLTSDRDHITYKKV